MDVFVTYRVCNTRSGTVNVVQDMNYTVRPESVFGDKSLANWCVVQWVVELEQESSTVFVPRECGSLQVLLVLLVREERLGVLGTYGTFGP
jgi:hypothetical protein